MGQRECLAFLKERYKKGIRKWYSAKEIKKQVGGSPVSSCGKLARVGFINFKVATHKKESGKNYKFHEYRYRP